MASCRFLVDTFSLKEKSPTITVGSFFSRRFSSEKSPTIIVASFIFFSSDYNPHPDWSTFLTTQTTKALGQVGPAET